jgi:outer membrane protein assembly factor BamB
MMSPAYRSTVVAWSVVLFCIGCSSQESPEGTAMFRGDPGHSGYFDGQGFDQLGGVRWQFQTGGPVRSSPTVLGDWLYVGSSDGHLYAIDRATGSPRWTANVASPVNSSPAVAAGLVILGSRDGTFHARDARSGQERWRFETGELLPWEWGFEGWDAYTSSPVVVDSVVLFGSGDGFLYALELASGREIWRFGTGGRIRSSPAVEGGVVFVGSADGRVYAVDLATGQERWRYEPHGVSLVSADFGFDRKSIISSPAVVDGTVYVGSRDGYMYAIDQATGEFKWRADHRVSWAMSSPAVVGDVLYSGTSDGNFVHALDVTSGNELWRFIAAGYTWSSPAVTDDGVYIGDAGGNLWALDRETGEVRWSYRTRGAVVSSPAVADGMVYFECDDGTVYALHGDGRYPHLAVFWDSNLRDFTMNSSHEVARAYFEEYGYVALDVEALNEFLNERIEDGAPSVVVFAMDYVPSAVASEPSDTTLFRRYLDAGGKVVWLGLPPMLFTRDPATGGVTALNREAGESLLGVDYAGVNFDSYGASATELGAQWGAPRWWVSSYAIDPADDVLVLGLDENGRIAAWVKSYGGPPGTGFVSLSAPRLWWDALPAIRAMAEYGL